MIIDHLDKARTRHQSCGSESPLVEDPSHKTDQPGGSLQGQVNSAVISSKFSHENNATSKAEYTNTQQGLPVLRIYLSPLTTHAGCEALGFLLWKSTKCKSL
jgi:hypothetical protein